MVSHRSEPASTSIDDFLRFFCVLRVFCGNNSAVQFEGCATGN